MLKKVSMCLAVMFTSQQVASDRSACAHAISDYGGAILDREREMDRIDLKNYALGLSKCYYEDRGDRVKYICPIIPEEEKIHLDESKYPMYQLEEDIVTGCGCDCECNSEQHSSEWYEEQYDLMDEWLRDEGEEIEFDAPLYNDTINDTEACPDGVVMSGFSPESEPGYNVELNGCIPSSQYYDESVKLRCDSEGKPELVVYTPDENNHDCNDGEDWFTSHQTELITKKVKKAFLKSGEKFTIIYRYGTDGYNDLKRALQRNGMKFCKADEDVCNNDDASDGSNAADEEESEDQSADESAAGRRL